MTLLDRFVLPPSDCDFVMTNDFIGRKTSNQAEDALQSILRRYRTKKQQGGFSICLMTTDLDKPVWHCQIEVRNTMASFAIKVFVNNKLLFEQSGLLLVDIEATLADYIGDAVRK